MLSWLAGDGHEEAGRDHAVDAISLRAPVPEPPSIRDFYAYEEHVATGNRLRGREVPDAWYEAPAFYFSNPASVHGPGEPVRRPGATHRSISNSRSPRSLARTGVSPASP